MHLVLCIKEYILIIEKILGAALNSMLEFFQALVNCRIPDLGYNDLLQMLLSPISTPFNPPVHKQAYYSLAKCVAAITVICPNRALPVVQQFIRDIQTARNDFQHIFGLLIIGEIGRKMLVNNQFDIISLLRL